MKLTVSSLRACSLALALVCLMPCTSIVHAQQPYTMTVNYANNQPSTTIAVWTVRSLSLTSAAGTSMPSGLAITYRAATASTTTLALSAIRDITFSGSPLYTGDTLRIGRKSGAALNIASTGIQKITFETLPTRVADASAANAYSARAYPNPSPSESSIDFTLAESRNITARVYDMQGRELTTLASGYYAAGKQTLYWNRTNTQSAIVPAGMYVCRITSGAEVLAETMMVLY